MLKKDFHDKKYFYILIYFIKLIKLSLESGAQRVTTGQYKHVNSSTKIHYVLNPH